MELLNDPTLLQERVRAALEEARGRVRAFREGSGDGEATVREFDRIGAPWNGLAGQVQLYTAVHPDKEMRDACEELERELSSFSTELRLDRGVFDRLAAVEGEPGLEPLARRALDHALRDFRRAGVDRDPEVRERVRALEEEVVAIGQEFDRNIIQGGRELVVEEGHAGLRGLPEDFLQAHPEREDGSVLLTTDPGDIMPVLTYAESDDLRRRYSEVIGLRACPENLEVLPRLLERRHELASLLGSASFADWIAGDKMAKSAEGIGAFLERVRALVDGPARREHAEMEAEKARLGSEDPVVHEYDRSYLVERIRKERHAFDSQLVRPYFPYARVVRGVLDLSAELYGVTFRPLEGASLWHESVEAYELLDGGEPIARLFLDMHPRDGKYKHAAQFDLCVGDGDELPAGVLVCNLPRPTQDDPALLMHDQVTTLFHEFGHLLHHLFAGRQRLLGFAGIATEFDFVEVPSQLYEEWAWSPAVLARFAHHFETDEPIPAELVERMRDAQVFGRATSTLVQLFYATLSLSYYDRDPRGLDTDAHLVALKERMLPTPHEPGRHFQAAFGHLNGYSALYYTYMWSLVIAKDLWSAFEQDPLNPETARRYRECVLGPGGTRDATDLVRAFLGRDFSFDAFERWLVGK